MANTSEKVNKVRRFVLLLLATISVIFGGWLWLAPPVSAQDPVTVITSTQEATGGFIFMTPGSLLIMDNAGQTIFSRQPGGAADFKRQGDVLTYFNSTLGRFEVLDQNYQLVDTWAAVGYPTDLHELQLLDNGHALLLVYREFEYDMSLVLPEGSPTATVVSCVIQELDENKNLAWQWDSWDHIPITHTNRLLTTSRIDYDHCNAVELDDDGNILLSSRHLDQITKINRQTGEVIWKLGGVDNHFNFTNDVGFALQHDIRRLSNGHITLFDNGIAARGYSRAVEYEIDEVNKTITRTWEFQGPFAFCCGNAQRLANGNTVINFGPGHPTLWEVKSDGTPVFVADTTFSYRGFRFNWFYRHYLPQVVKKGDGSIQID